MQNLEDRLIQKVRATERTLLDRYAKDWRRAETVEERELLHVKQAVVSDLTKTIIHSIRGEKNG